ncbi:hypothetical protein ERC79_13485 [Rhodococcus sp. ABRD24]|nr:hypothetical protein ERC79_13485 [Rhodococcus sp. ABRD24]
MTPSLLPRAWYFQGIATGVSCVIGYALGVVVAWIVRKIGFDPQWSAQTRRRGWLALAVAAVIVVPLFLYLGSSWQATVRSLVAVEETPRSLYLLVLTVAVLVAMLLLGIGRLFRAGTRRVAKFGSRFVPAPVARAVAVVLVAFLSFTIANDALYQGFLRLANNAFAEADHGTHPGTEQPTAPERSGSPASTQAWDTLGQEGRQFVAAGPTAEQLTEFSARPAQTPIRAYAGMASADDLEGVAQNVVAELDRTGAFDRAVLAVATTTGRGWVNPSAANSLEYLWNGDTAIAAMQYSFLPSPVAFLTDVETPKDAGRILFEAVHAAWAQLPEAQRPKLVVFGESLGAFGGQSAFTGAQDMVARTDGALWVGNPSFSEQWQRITDSRDPGSPEILPIVDEGHSVRFSSRPSDLDLPAQWADPRVVYLQHASDPIVWWSPRLILHKPDWLSEPRGRDVDPAMQWIPGVTFFQVAIDMAFSNAVPDGYGHSYGPEVAVAWAKIVPPTGWTDADTDRLAEREAAS